MIFNISIIALLILSVLLTLITCTAIITEKNGNPKLQWLIFALLFGISLYYLVHVLVFTKVISDVPFLLRGFVPFYYFSQPAIYFYVVVNLDENYTFSKKDLWHLIPVLYSIIDNWGFYSGGAQHWQFWADSIAKNYGNIANYQGVIFNAKYNFILRVLLYISYLLMAWRYYIKNIHEIKDQFILKWLKLFLIIISVFVVSVVLATVYNSTFVLSLNNDSNFYFMFPLIITSLSIILLSSYILFNPILLYGLPKINFKTIVDNDQSLSKFKVLKIENEEIEKKEYNLAITIVSEIKEKQIYKDVNFSLAMASKHFSIPVHHISFVINKYIKKSFPDIVCEMRIDHAIQLLKDNINKKYTMEAIGNLSGFNSRTSFYVSFKKNTGITPNEYLQNLKLS